MSVKPTRRIQVMQRYFWLFFSFLCGLHAYLLHCKVNVAFTSVSLVRFHRRSRETPVGERKQGTKRIIRSTRRTVQLRAGVLLSPSEEEGKENAQSKQRKRARTPVPLITTAVSQKRLKVVSFCVLGSSHTVRPAESFFEVTPATFFFPYT